MSDVSIVQVIVWLVVAILAVLGFVPPRLVMPSGSLWPIVGYLLRPGDVALAPRMVPHVWASVGDTGRILITFSPAGHMEAFVREVTRGDAMPGQDPELWRRHGMRIVGPHIGTPLELG